MAQGIIRPEVLLPRELVDLIVGHLDNEDLAVCTLLSRHWHTSAHTRLFRSILVQDSIFKDGPDSEDDDPIGDFAKFLLSDPSSNVVPYIKVLTLMGRDGFHYWMTVIELHTILAKLPALEILHLHEIRLLHSSSSVEHNWASPRPLKMFLLTSSIISSPRCSLNNPRASSGAAAEDVLTVKCCFVQLVNLFNYVEEFYLDHVEFGRDDAPNHRSIGYGKSFELAAPAALEVSKTFRIRKLISKALDRSILELLGILQANQCSLDTLQLEPSDEWDQTCCKFLRTAGHNLSCLHLAIGTRPGEVEKEVCLYEL